MKNASDVFLKLSGDGVAVDDGRRPLLRRSLFAVAALLVAFSLLLYGPMLARGADENAVVNKPTAVAADDDDNDGSGGGDDDSGPSDATGGDRRDAQTLGTTNQASDQQTGRETGGQTDRGAKATGVSTRGETDPGDATGKTERR